MVEFFRNLLGATFRYCIGRRREPAEDCPSYSEGRTCARTHGRARPQVCCCNRRRVHQQISCCAWAKSPIVREPRGSPPVGCTAAYILVSAIWRTSRV